MHQTMIESFESQEEIKELFFPDMKFDGKKYTTRKFMIRCDRLNDALIGFKLAWEYQQKKLEEAKKTCNYLSDKLQTMERPIVDRDSIKNNAPFGATHFKDYPVTYLRDDDGDFFIWQHNKWMKTHQGLKLHPQPL